MENTCFRDPVWLQYNVLTNDSVLGYFSFSQFYDRKCNNEVLKMQTAYSTLSDIDGYLKRMVGTQYHVHRAEEPHFFVIKRCERFSPDKITVHEYFYILHGTVYQAPTEKEVSRTRYTNIMFLLMGTLDNLPFREAAKQEAQEGAEVLEKKKGASASRIAGLFSSYYTDYLKE